MLSSAKPTIYNIPTIYGVTRDALTGGARRKAYAIHMSGKVLKAEVFTSKLTL